MPAARDEPEAAAHEPAINEADRFSINGKPLSFAAFVATTMSRLGSREPCAPAPQPAPETWDVIWLSRAPSESGGSGEPQRGRRRAGKGGAR